MGAKHMRKNAHWNCSLKSSCGKRPLAQNAKSGKSKALQAEKRKVERGSWPLMAGFWISSPKASLFANTWFCFLAHQGSKALKLPTLGKLVLPKVFMDSTGRYKVRRALKNIVDFLYP
jgi:hypothetical protein